MQEPSNGAPPIRISMVMVGGWIGFHAPSQKTAAETAAAFLIVPKGLIMGTAKESFVGGAPRNTFDPITSPMFFPGDPSIRMLGILLLFLIRN